MSEFTIESGIPIPPSERQYGKYPFRQMQVGDSIFVRFNGKAYSLAGYFRKKTGHKFVTRKVEGGYRIWRTE